MGKGEDVGRRGFLAAVSAAAGAVAVTGSQQVLAQGPRGCDGAPEAQSPLPLRNGSQLGAFKIVRAHALHLGAVPVVLEAPTGARFQVDVLLRDPNPRRPDGVGNTGALSIYLANCGDGETATIEEQGLGAMALADALATSESVSTDGLLTLAQRHERHPGGAYAVPLG